jgi:predicted metal-dependent hydrolase
LLSIPKIGLSKNQFLKSLKNLNLESLTREDLIELVQKQLHSQNEAHKQLEEVKKEAEESAKQQAKKLLASQQKVEQLTAVMANQLNVEHQKHLDSAKQAEV